MSPTVCGGKGVRAPLFESGRRTPIFRRHNIIKSTHNYTQSTKISFTVEDTNIDPERLRAENSGPSTFQPKVTSL